MIKEAFKAFIAAQVGQIQREKTCLMFKRDTLDINNVSLMNKCRTHLYLTSVTIPPSAAKKKYYRVSGPRERDITSAPHVTLFGLGSGQDGEE